MVGGSQSVVQNVTTSSLRLRRFFRLLGGSCSSSWAGGGGSVRFDSDRSPLNSSRSSSSSLSCGLVMRRHHTHTLRCASDEVQRGLKNRSESDSRYRMTHHSQKHSSQAGDKLKIWHEARTNSKAYFEFVIRTWSNVNGFSVKKSGTEKACKKKKAS